MKRFFNAMFCAMLALSASAQTWNLNELTAEDFEAGGDEHWLFEKLTYATGECQPFATFGTQSTCNYVDLYQPERVGGQLFQDIAADMEINGEFTWALTLRNAWYDTEWTSPSRTDANEKFVYVSRADMLGNIFEVCGNKDYNAIISFQATTDGFYQVSGSIIRQDGANLKALKLIPCFRPDGLERIDGSLTLGLEFPFGEGGSNIDGATNTSLATGYNQRYTAQTPADFGFAVRLNEGDIISFEVSYQDLTTSAWPRDYYPRVFFRQLSVTATDEATARADEHFVDPYEQGSLTQLTDKIAEYEAQYKNIHVGDQPGDVSEEGAIAFEEALSAIQDAIREEAVNALNADYYLQMLEEAWQALMKDIVRVDPFAAGNFRLITSTGTPGTEELELTPDEEAFAANNDTPWGFYGRVVADGTLEKFPNHDANNKSGENAWYKGGGQWYYVTERGAMHPLLDRAPGVQFTAPEAGIYRFDLGAYRPNPNPKVENPLYVRCYVLTGDMTTVQSNQAILSKQYGSVANDGAEGKAPITLAFYASLNAGDRVFMELDAYTSGSIASAGTQLLNLTACRFVTEGQAITLADAQASGELFINPNAQGDATELRAAIAEAEALVKETEENLGEGDGQYDEAYFSILAMALEEAAEVLTLEGMPDGTQARFDEIRLRLEQAIADLKRSKVNYHLVVRGDYSISIAGTDKHLTRNNFGSGGGPSYYYANFFNAEGVINDAARFEGWEAEDYSWTFTFEPSEADERYIHITSGEYGWLTQDGYVQSGGDDNPEQHLFELLVEKPGDEVFAVRRPDGLYWGTTMNWNAPYNRISISKEPLFVFTLTNDTPLAIAATESRPVRVDYFDLLGRRIARNAASTNGRSHGIVIRRTTMADGSVHSEKVLR